MLSLLLSRASYLCIADSNSSVPGSAGHRVELEVLFEAASGGGSIREPLFFQVNAQVVEEGYHY